MYSTQPFSKFNPNYPTFQKNNVPEKHAKIEVFLKKCNFFLID